MTYHALSRLGVTFRPLDEPLPGAQRRSNFSASLSTTVDTLGSELIRLGAKRVVVMVALREEDIRLDGFPRADRRAAHPGVVLAFESKWGPLKYATAEYSTWEDNLRAIALSMQALRAVDRYGVSKRGEQYRGWRQLPTGGSTDEPELSLEQAARILAEQGENDEYVPTSDDIAEIAQVIRDVPAEATRYYRLAAAKNHPDKGGTAEGFRLVQRAYERVKGAA